MVANTMVCVIRVSVLVLLLFLFLSPANAIRSFPSKTRDRVDESGIEIDLGLEFSEAPEYRNEPQCPVSSGEEEGSVSVCDPVLIHIAMTIDVEYLRGSMAAVHSILKHSSCPDNIFFHFIASNSNSINPDIFPRIVKSVFPSLNFRVYAFDDSSVKNLISSSIRPALESPLNYARTYLADLLDGCVDRVIYLDSDVLVVDDIQKLWRTNLIGSRVIGAPVYCHANFKRYFSDEFWSDEELSGVFAGKNPCYFNTGVMVMDLGRWREGQYTKKIEKWMEIQKERRIYELGSLPPFLLVFGGEVQGIDHRWNQHGLGGDNVVSSCRRLHPGPVSLMHWSGKEKPWKRIDGGKPCPVDHLWAPYDLLRSRQQKEQLLISSYSLWQLI